MLIAPTGERLADVCSFPELTTTSLDAMTQAIQRGTRQPRGRTYLLYTPLMGDQPNLSAARPARDFAWSRFLPVE